MLDPASQKEVTVRLIDLPSSSKGYQFALTEFNKTMKQGFKCKYTTIVKIQRIQNPHLYRQFIEKKKLLDSNNPQGFQNERWLFHGTKVAAISSINRTNFNRNFRGQNGRWQFYIK